MRNLLMFAAVSCASATFVVGCAGGGESPPIQGVSSERVQSEIAGLNCASSRDILASPNVTEDLFFGTMSGYVAGQVGGTENEWRAVIDWWWQTACGGQ